MSRPRRKASQEHAQKRLTALKEELQGRSTLDRAATTFTPQTLEAYLSPGFALSLGCGSSPAEGSERVPSLDPSQSGLGGVEPGRKRIRGLRESAKRGRPYRVHRYRLNAGGERAAVERLRAPDRVRQLRLSCPPRTLSLALVGDLDPDDTARRVTEALRGAPAASLSPPVSLGPLSIDITGAQVPAHTRSGLLVLVALTERGMNRRVERGPEHVLRCSSVGSTAPPVRAQHRVGHGSASQA